MRRTLARHSDRLVAVLLPAVCLFGAWAISLAIPMPDEDDFNVVSWELRHVPGKWLYLAGRFFEGGLSSDEEDGRLLAFLRVNSEVRSVEIGLSNDDPERRAQLDELLGRRDALENDAEAIIEGRLTAVLEEAGLESSLPLFPRASWVFPPVDVEFDEPPRSLAISARDRIELIERRPLRPGLALDEAVDREAAVESAGDLSALVGPLSGAATYPSIVAPRAGYQQLVATVAHEWVHHYLFFKPLGARYYDSVELRTLNETVADIAGQALAALVVARYPLDGGAFGGSEEPAPQQEVDVDAFLRDLRLDAEALLAGGRIEAAEALMEERRLELAEQGVVFRRINQAFFAARGLYADVPGSTDPIGDKLETLFAGSTDVAEFLRAAADLTSEADLDALVAATASGTARR